MKPGSKWSHGVRSQGASKELGRQGTSQQGTICPNIRLYP